MSIIEYLRVISLASRSEMIRAGYIMCAKKILIKYKDGVAKKIVPLICWRSCWGLLK